jgi:hypothetical protein
MNHPTPETWMSYLYHEVKPRERATLQAHLSTCADCRAQVESWSQVQKDLRHWRIRPAPRAPWVLPVVRWAAAALIFLSVGFSAGRLAEPSAAQVARLQAALEPTLRRQLKAELDQSLAASQQRAAASTIESANQDARALLADYARYQEAQRQQDQASTVTRFNQIENQRLNDHRTLRKELEMVALMTDAGLRRTQEQIIELADAAPTNSN